MAGGSDLAHPGLAVVIMGVSGCGKSTVAAMLAEALGCSFVEADDHHSPANKAKMRKGVPLTDADRAPWLETLRGEIRERLDRGEDVAVSCSALRRKYREVLREGDRGYKAGGSYAACRVKFVCLEASAEVIAARVERRAKEGGHFMPVSLLQSQLDLLQIDEAEGITEVDAAVRPDAIVRAAIAQFREELASSVLTSPEHFSCSLLNESSFISVLGRAMIHSMVYNFNTCNRRKKRSQATFNITQFI